MVGVLKLGSRPPGEKTEHGTLFARRSKLHPGGGCVGGRGILESSGPVNVTSELNGGFERRKAIMSCRSFAIEKPARTDHEPVPVGSQANPTRGWSSAKA